MAHRGWLRCFAVVTFDVDKGQVLEECFPPGEVRATPAAAALPLAAMAT
jgi:hypothetical protein